MKRFSEQLKKKSQSVHMRVAERRELRERVISYMEYHPLPQTQQKNTKQYLEAEQRFSFFHFNTPHIRGFATMFAVCVLIIVPVIAEKSVPGDILYPVKVNFTEEIRSTLTVSPYARIELETRLLERRIAEARLLASEGKLTPEVEKGVAAAVKIHSDAAQSEIASLRESDSDEAAIAEIAFGSALSVQAEMLEGSLKKAAAAAGEGMAEEGPVTALTSAVAEARKGVEENQVKQNPSYEKMIARIEIETTRAFELFADVRKVATQEEVTDVERRLKDIERKVADAVVVHTETENEALQASSTVATPRADVVLLRTALSDLQKLISFMTDIDVRENVTVESLVPVTLTHEEIKAFLTEQQRDAETRIDAARSALVAYEGEGEQTEKISIGLERAAELASSTQSAIKADDLTTAEQFATEARAYLSDIENMLGDTKPVLTPTATEDNKKSATEGETKTEGEGATVEEKVPAESEKVTEKRPIPTKNPN